MLEQICIILDGLENKEGSDCHETQGRDDVTSNDDTVLPGRGLDLEPRLVPIWFHFDPRFVL